MLQGVVELTLKTNTGMFHVGVATESEEYYTLYKFNGKFFIKKVSLFELITLLSGGVSLHTFYLNNALVADVEFENSNGALIFTVFQLYKTKEVEGILDTIDREKQSCIRYLNLLKNKYNDISSPANRKIALSYGTVSYGDICRWECVKALAPKSNKNWRVVKDNRYKHLYLNNITTTTSGDALCVTSSYFEVETLDDALYLYSAGESSLVGRHGFCLNTVYSHSSF